MAHLILLRGLPGSGKSTIAGILVEDNYPVFSVDDYFTNEKTNKYIFEYDKNHLAYKQCINNVKKAMAGKITKIFVDNTFTLDWEIEPYLKLASEFNYSIYVLTVEKYHSHKDIHSISDEQLQKMAAKYKVKLL